MIKEIKITDLNLEQLRNLCNVSREDMAKLFKITKQGYIYKEKFERGLKKEELELIRKIFKLSEGEVEKIIKNKTNNKFKIIIEENLLK